MTRNETEVCNAEMMTQDRTDMLGKNEMTPDRTRMQGKNEITPDTTDTLGKNEMIPDRTGTQEKNEMSPDTTDAQEKVMNIWRHPLFQAALTETERLEQGRIFCGHSRTHLFDVARIAYIENLERGAGVPRHMIYAAALLHDTGRYLQYTDGTPHHVASARIAVRVLSDCGFSEAETKAILQAILSHRDPGTMSDPGLPGLIYRADKRSRCCFACAAETECNWSDEKKNLILTL